jgi:hypothetical protein
LRGILDLLAAQARHDDEPAVHFRKHGHKRVINVNGS